MIVAFLAGLVALAAMLIALEPFPGTNRPGLRSLTAVGFGIGIPSAVILVGLETDPKLLPVAVVLAVLGGATATDLLRNRMMNATLVLFATGFVLAFCLGLSLVNGENQTIVMSLLGVLFTAGAGVLLFGGGALYARLRGISAEALADEDLGPAFGWGDVIAYALIGALLGPMWGLIAFALGLFANAPVALLMFASNRLRGRATTELYMPYLPGITIGTMLVLLYIASSN